MSKWLAIVGCGVLLVAGCNGSIMQARVVGDHESAVAMPGVVTDRGAEVGARIQWYEADFAGGPNETVSIGPYGAVPIDPNSLEALGLPGWETPLGVDLKLGGYLSVDTEESGTIMGPMVIADRPITDNLSVSTVYEYTAFEDNTEKIGYQDQSRVYFGAAYRF